MKNYQHALIIGGTGMLAAASKHIAQQAQHCSVIGRNPQRLQTLKNPAMHPVVLDYTDASYFESELNRLCQDFGSFDLVLLWIHASGQKAREQVYNKIKSQNNACRLVEVLGSAAADPSRKLSPPDMPVEVKVIQVVLGFQIEAQGSRWLNHAEISQGAIEALHANASPVIVGHVRPWSARP